MTAAAWLPAALAAAGGLCIIAAMIRTRRPVRTLFRSAAAGLSALVLVNLTGEITGVTLTVSPAALGCSCLCGVPGVIGMLVMKLFA